MYVQLSEDLSSPTTREIQCQLLDSHFVLKALLDEFSNIDSIYESYMPTIQSAVRLLKTESKKLSPPENPMI